MTTGINQSFYSKILLIKNIAIEVSEKKTAMARERSQNLQRNFYKKIVAWQCSSMSRYNRAYEERENPTANCA